MIRNQPLLYIIFGSFSSVLCGFLAPSWQFSRAVQSFRDVAANLHCYLSSSPKRLPLYFACHKLEFMYIKRLVLCIFHVVWCRFSMQRQRPVIKLFTTVYNIVYKILMTKQNIACYNWICFFSKRKSHNSSPFIKANKKGLLIGSDFVTNISHFKRKLLYQFSVNEYTKLVQHVLKNN